MAGTRFGHLDCTGCIGTLLALFVCALVAPQSKSAAGTVKPGPAIEFMKAEAAGPKNLAFFHSKLGFSAGGTRRPATVADSIEMIRVVGSGKSAGATPEPLLPTSPGSHLTRSGSSLL